MTTNEVEAMSERLAKAKDVYANVLRLRTARDYIGKLEPQHIGHHVTTHCRDLESQEKVRGIVLGSIDHELSQAERELTAI